MPNREQRRAAAKNNDDQSIIITVDAVKYRFDPGQMTSAIERELWTQAGLTEAGILGAFQRREFAPFMIAGLVFLARRSRGDQITYDEIEGSISYNSEIELDFGDSDEDEAPEVSAAD